MVGKTMPETTHVGLVYTNAEDWGMVLALQYLLHEFDHHHVIYPMITYLILSHQDYFYMTIWLFVT